MPNRIIKESICSSESIDSLSWFEECLFYRLIVNCDDYGRMDARPKMLKSRLFPLKDRISLKDIEDALVKLADAGCVTLYECDSKPYLYLPTWEVHQTIRAKKSKYPDPNGSNVRSVESGMNPREIICKQMNADENNSNHTNANVPVIQSNPNPIRNTNTNARADRFQEFAAAYPKPGAGCYAAGVEYIKTLQMGVSESDLIQSAKNYSESCKILGTAEQFMLNAENFLKKLSFDAYLPGKYKKPEKKKQSNSKVDQYNTFMQNSYDIDELEAKLLGEK